jgi:xanthine dehydrogenase YagT iron-sulfur-binding subunit
LIQGTLPMKKQLSCADSHCSDALSRRSFIKQAGIGGIGISSGAVILSGCGEAAQKSAVSPLAPPKSNSEPAEPVEMVDLELTINKQKHALKIDTRTTLLDLLREKLDMTGTKKGCDHGQCGACTVLVNGRALNSCLALAALHSGSEIQTVEGLGTETELHPVQAVFIKHDAFQCGYCTPGQIMSAVALVNLGQPRTADEIREFMSGNICRCGAYPNIVAAVLEAQKGASVQEKKT